LSLVLFAEVMRLRIKNEQMITKRNWNVFVSI
jgi:hypothetical protein